MRAFITFGLLILSVFPVKGTNAASPEIRVLIAEDIPRGTIEGVSSPLEVTSAAGPKISVIGTLKVTAQNGEIRIGRKDFGKTIAVSNSTRKYRTPGKVLRGTITIAAIPPSSLMIINNLPLEDYLSGLINSEISSSWPIEAIKSQAVAARTYALNQIENSRKSPAQRFFDIRSTMMDQVYDGAHLEDSRSLKAVGQTRGEVLLRNGAIFPAYYHSCCGGHTEHAHNVWPGEAGPPVIDDEHCSKSPKFAWTYEISTARFAEILRSQDIALEGIHSIAITSFSDSPRVEMVLIEDNLGLKMIKATELRKIFGYHNIKSTWFEVRLENKNISFRGRGYGHGVGLCQWGAKNMAEVGIDYRNILKFYYPDADVKVLY